MRTDGPFDVRDALQERGHRFDYRGLRLRRIQGAARCCQMSALVRRGEQAIVANALESTGEHVLQEALDELDTGHTNGALLAALAVDSDAKGYRLRVDAEDALVGDRHAMGVAAQILEHLGGSRAGLLGIHHPVMEKELVL